MWTASRKRAIPGLEQDPGAGSVSAVRETCPETRRVQQRGEGIPGHPDWHERPRRRWPSPARTGHRRARRVRPGLLSTREENLARQRVALTAAGCAKCFFDKASGRNADRPGLGEAFGYLRPGDVLTVVSLDRLGRSLEDLIGIVARLKREGVGFQSLHEKLDTTTPGGMFVFHVFAALAEFIRTIIVANTNEGLAAARARGQRLGRPPAMTPEKIAYARQLLTEPDRTICASPLASTRAP